MSTRSRPAQLFCQRTALLLALICLWISGGATLHHTDDVSAFLTFHAGQSAVGHATPPPLQLPCAACEWEQALATPHQPAVPIVANTLVRRHYAALLSLALHLQSFDYTSLRAPPAALS